MNKRSEQEWRDLFAQQAASGLSAQKFCQANKLCKKYFSVRKKQLQGNGVVLPSAFVPVVAIKKSSALAGPFTGAALVMRQGTCTLQFSALPDSAWLAQFIRLCA